jgi:serine/threonine-protein kinase
VSPRLDTHSEEGPDAVQRWADIERAFAAALDLPPDARAAYLASASTDPAVRDVVARLLERHVSLEAQDSGFLTPLDPGRAAALLGDADAVPPRIGRHEVRGVLGRGAFGTVYLAHDPELGRAVAIKRLAGHLEHDGPWIERFVAEARAASQLAHPHIVTVHDIGRDDDGRLFIVMGYAAGGTLRDALGHGPLDVDTALRHAVAVADGLAAAHAVGLVHRDIKPENLLVTPHGVRITDFGIAKAIASPSTPIGAVLGTAAYMSPEQSRGFDVDARSDLWSLGVVLFELLTGTRPFAGSSRSQTIEAIRLADAPAPSTLRPEVPASVDAIVARCLAKEPADRFASADAVRDALRDALRAARHAMQHDVPTGATHDVSDRSSRVSLGSRRRVVVLGAAVATLALGARWLPTGDDATEAVAMPSSLGVLPFAVPDTLASGRVLGGVIATSLRQQLAATPGLRVPAFAHIMAAQRQGGPPDVIGTRSGVDAMLTGAVHREADDVTIEAALVRSGRGDTLWTARLRRPVGELAVAEREIVTSVAAALGASARPWRAPDPVAYALYLRGRRVLDRWNDSTVEPAAFYFREAIARDSGFARAYLGLASTYTALQNTPPGDRFRLAKPLVARAIAAEPDLAEAHAQAASIAAWYDHDWDAAERHYQRALALDPNEIWTYHGYAALLNATGRLDSSLAITRRAMPLDPDGASTATHLAIHLAYQDRRAEAIAILQRVIARDSLAWPRAFVVLGRLYLADGRAEDALPLFRRHAPQYAGLEARGVHAWALAASGRMAEARTMVASMEAEARAGLLGAINLVAAHTGLGDTARALDWLERVPDDRGHMLFLLTDSFYDPLRGSPRWRRVIARLGLTAADTVRRAPPG